MSTELKVETNENSLDAQLVVAAYEGDVNEVERLLDAGANVNAYGIVDGCDYMGTALVLAVYAASEKADKTRQDNCIKVATMLIEKGADVNFQPSEEPPPRHERAAPVIHYTVGKGRTEFLKLLIAKGVDVNSTGPDGTEDLPVWDEARYGTLEAVEVLVEAGADIKEAARSAVTYKREDILIALLDKDVDPNLNDGELLVLAVRTNAASYPEEENWEDVTKVLLDAGASITPKNKQAVTLGIIKRMSESHGEVDAISKAVSWPQENGYQELYSNLQAQQPAGAPSNPGDNW
ncbi:MAG: hypothetical protein DHS20C02_07090 [Micavibrio sp.]|nr:MAG: hypothetical protein DHS20C02_07090 [Micavibrio sp.]